MFGLIFLHQEKKDSINNLYRINIVFTFTLVIKKRLVAIALKKNRIFFPVPGENFRLILKKLVKISGLAKYKITNFSKFFLTLIYPFFRIFRKIHLKIL